jgi:hypothetical protein
MSAALDFQGDPAMTKAQSKLFVLQPVRRSGRARPPLLPALKKSTTRLREAATRDKDFVHRELMEYLAAISRSVQLVRELDQGAPTF